MKQPPLPPDRLPRSPSGRIPTWVLDEAAGNRATPTAWRSAQVPLDVLAPGRRPWGRRLGIGLGLLLVLGWGTSEALVAVTAPDPVPGPPPGLEESAQPLGNPPPVPAGGAGKYRYLNIAEAGTPVTFSPCRPIHYVIRPDHQPKGGAKLIRSAIADLSQATGLQFKEDGTTDEAPAPDRAPYQPDRYGDRWAPVLIAWASPQEVPDLDNDVLGAAGPQPVSRSDGTEAFVSGTLTLDAEGMAELLREQGRAVAKAVVLHEFGHLVGLDHVANADQLMYPTISAVTTYQPGDLTGLAKLGTGPCQTTL